MKHKIWALVLSFLVLASFLPALLYPVHGYGETWLSPWLYRKSHVINNSTGAGADYTVKLVVCNGSDTDSGPLVYITNFLKSDFGDIRFTAGDGSTLLYYWIEEINSAENCTFWVRITDDLDDAASTIFLYYGNSGASSISNGPGTFLKFDDFANATTYGGRYPVTKGDAAYWAGSYWDITVNGTSGLDLGGRTGVYFTQEKRDKISQSGVYVAGIDFIHYNLLASNCSISVDFEYYINRSYTVRNYWDVYASVVYNYSGTVNMTRIYNAYQPGYQYRYNGFSIGVASGLDVIAGATTVRTGDLIQTWYNRTENSTVASNGGVVDVYIGVGGGFDNNYGYGSLEVFWDKLRIRKYVSDEPTHGAWGEETNAVAFITVFFTSGGTVTYNDTLAVNGSVNVWNNNSLVEFKALVDGNNTYTFANFSIGGSGNISNPFDYWAVSNFTIWVYFEIVTGGGAIDRARPEDLAGLLIGGLISVLILIVVLVVRRRK